jgi:hypothetical protein
MRGCSHHALQGNGLGQRCDSGSSRHAIRSRTAFMCRPLRKRLRRAAGGAPLRRWHHQSRKLLKLSGMSAMSLRISAMAACKSSRLAPVTRTASPWMAACTLSLLSLMRRGFSWPSSVFDAVAHLDHLLDLVAAHLLHVAHVQEAHVHIALGELVAQDVLDLGELEVGVAKQGDFLVFQLNGGRGALEVKSGGDFLGGVVDRVLTSTMLASQTVSNEGMSGPWT